VHQVCSEARVGDVVDCPVYEVPQTGLRVEDIEVVVPDLLVIVEIWLKLGVSMEGEAIDRAIFMISPHYICFFPVKDVADVVGGD
jgi:hypothetical protein